MKNISKIKINTNKKMTEVIKNDGNLYVVSAKTGSGKTYSAGEVVANLVSKNRAEGNRERIIFTSGQKANLPVKEMEDALRGRGIEGYIVLPLTSKEDSLDKLNKKFFYEANPRKGVNNTILSDIRTKVVSILGDSKIVDDIFETMMTDFKKHKGEIKYSTISYSINKIYFDMIFKLMNSSLMFSNAHTKEARVYYMSRYISEDLTIFFSDYFFESADVVLMSHYKLFSSKVYLKSVDSSGITMYPKKVSHIDNSLIIIDESEQLIHSFNDHVLKLEKIPVPSPNHVQNTILELSSYSPADNWIDFKNTINKKMYDSSSGSVMGIYSVIESLQNEDNWSSLSRILTNFYRKVSSIVELSGLPEEEMMSKIRMSLMMVGLRVDKSVEGGFYTEAKDGRAYKTNAKTQFMLKDSDFLYVDSGLITKGRSQYKLDDLINISRGVYRAFDYLIRELMSIENVKGRYSLILFMIQVLYSVSESQAKEIKEALEVNSWNESIRGDYCSVSTTIFEKKVESNEDEWLYRVESPKYYYIEDVLTEMVELNTIVLMSATIKLNTTFEGFDFEYLREVLKGKGCSMIDVMGVTPKEILDEMSVEKSKNIEIVVIPKWNDSLEDISKFIDSLVEKYPLKFTSDKALNSKKFIEQILSGISKVKKENDEEEGDYNYNEENRIRSIINSFISLLVLNLEGVKSSLSLMNISQNKDSLKSAAMEVNKIMGGKIKTALLTASIEKGIKSDEQEVKFVVPHVSGTMTSIHTSIQNGSTGKNYMVNIDGEDLDVEALCLVRPTNIIESKINMKSEMYHSNRKKNLKHSIIMGGNNTKIKESAYYLDNLTTQVKGSSIGEPFIFEVVKKYISVIEQSIGRMSRVGNSSRKVIVVTKDILPWDFRDSVETRNSYYRSVLKDISYKGYNGFAPHELSHEIIMINEGIEEYMRKENVDIIKEFMIGKGKNYDENKFSRLISDTIAEAAKGVGAKFSKSMKSLIKEGPSEFKLKNFSGEVVYDGVFRGLPIEYSPEFPKAYISMSTDKFVKHDSNYDYWKFVEEGTEGAIKYDWNYVLSNDVIRLYNRCVEVGVVSGFKISPDTSSDLLHPGIFYAMYIPRLSEIIVHSMLGNYSDKMPSGVHFEQFDLHREEKQGNIWVDVKDISSYSDDILRSSESMIAVEEKLDSVNLIKTSGIVHFINLFNKDKRKTHEIMSKIKDDIYSSVLFDLSSGQEIESIDVLEIHRLSDKIKKKTKEVLDERSKNK